MEYDIIEVQEDGVSFSQTRVQVEFTIDEIGALGRLKPGGPRHVEDMIKKLDDLHKLALGEARRKLDKKVIEDLTHRLVEKDMALLVAEGQVSSLAREREVMLHRENALVEANDGLADRLAAAEDELVEFQNDVDSLLDRILSIESNVQFDELCETIRGQYNAELDRIERDEARKARPVENGYSLRHGFVGAVDERQLRHGFVDERQQAFDDTEPDPNEMGEYIVALEELTSATGV